MAPRLRRITHGRSLSSAQLGPGVRAHPVLHPTRVEVPEHGHASASLSLVLTGAFRERRSEATRDCGPLDVLFKPPGLPHASATGAWATRTITLSLDPSTLPAELAGARRAIQTTGGPVATGLLEVARTLADASEDPVCGAVVDSVLAELVRHARAGRAEVAEERSTAPERMADAARRLARGASVRSAAEVAGMHPVSFARAFQRRSGLTPSVYRRRRLVARAAAAIPGAEGRLAAVAHDVGFADQAHMTRAFRAETGLPPGAYRSLVAELFRGA